MQLRLGEIQLKDHTLWTENEATKAIFMSTVMIDCFVFCYLPEPFL